MEQLNNKQIMGENITYYMERFGKTRMDLCQELGVCYTTLTDWVNGNKYPRIDKIEKLANYFGVTKSDLVEKRMERPAPLDEMKVALFGGDGEVTDEMWEEVKAYAKFIKERNENANK